MVSSVRPLYKSNIWLPLGNTQTTAQNYPSPNLLSRLDQCLLFLIPLLESVLLTLARQWVLGMFWVYTGSSVAPIAPLPSPSWLLIPQTSVTGKSLRDSSLLIQMQAPSMAGLDLAGVLASQVHALKFPVVSCTQAFRDLRCPLLSGPP